MLLQGAIANNQVELHEQDTTQENRATAHSASSENAVVKQNNYQSEQVEKTCNMACICIYDYS